MLSFLVDAQAFLGGGQTIFANEGDQPPIAVDDTLDVLRGSGAVTVAVLANDVDPEGQPLILVSAFAALGTAVAEIDGTVTYTPPQGPAAEFNDFDTVVYEIEDVNGARDSAQINVTISDPELSITTLSDNTLQVTASDGTIDITVTTPVEFAGTYTTDLGDLAQGPVNLVAPEISGTVVVGNTLSANEGLWIFDSTVAAPSQGWQWQRGEIDIPGATSATYQVQAGDVELGLRAIETLSNPLGSQSAASAATASFNPAADPLAIAWWDASDVATITEGGSNNVEGWADKIASLVLIQANGAREPTTGVRQLNGLNVIDFDGGDFLEASLNVPVSGNVAFHMVIAIDSTANAFEAVLSADATNDFQIDANNASAFDGRLNLSGAGAPVDLTGGPFAGALILSAVFDRTGAATASVFIADSLRGTTAYSQPLDVAQSLHVMTNRSQNAWVNGAVAELIITEDVTNRANHHAYLASKWGIS